VSVVPDQTVQRGGCVVESDFGLIDATVDAQFAELSRALLGDATQKVAPGLGD
jgi:flagellar assembly protein FliH